MGRRWVSARATLAAAALCVSISACTADDEVAVPSQISASAVSAVPATDALSASASASASAPPTVVSPTTNPSRSLSCADGELDEIIELLQSGSIPVEFNRIAGLDTMVALGDRTVTGNITSVVRERGESVDWTTLDIKVTEMLAGPQADEIVERISFMSSRTSPTGDDPIAQPVTIEGLRFVAVLDRFPDAPGGWSTYAQGLSVACDDTVPVVAVQERIPNMPLAKSWSIIELVEAVRAMDLTVPVPAEPIRRPIFDPNVCETISVREGTGADFPIAPFAKPSEFPVPIQVFADPSLGPAGPIVMVLRFRDRPDDRVVRTGPWGGTGYDDVYAQVLDNGVGEASWNAGDGTTGYMRSIGVDEVGALVKHIAFSVPRELDAPIPGFDFWSNPEREGTPSINGQLHLIHEAVDADVGESSFSTSECIVRSTGFVYRTTRSTADPVMLYRAVLDRPAPLEVGMSGDDVIIINGNSDDAAPTVADVHNATDDEWRAVPETGPGLEAD